ncbi:hypothetical protein H0H93_010848, partial [Arthromyces matolae]
STACYRCGGEGHFAKECPNNPAPPPRAHIRAAHTAAPSEHGSLRDDPEPEDPDEGSHHSDQESHYSQHPESDIDNDDEFVTVDVYDNDYYASPEDNDFLMAMTDYSPNEADQQDERQFVRMKQVRLKKSSSKIARPKYRKEEKECLVTYVEVEGHKAWTLWDSGSTTTGMTPSFLSVYGIPVQELEEPLVLQLGTVGSRSKVLYGTHINMSVGGINTTEYVDVANFDRYDMIIGTPYMRKNKVVLDFVKNEVIIGGKVIPAQRVTVEEAAGRLRRQRATEKKDEDVEEEVQMVAGLSTDYPSLLVSEEEYQDTLEKGKEVPHKKNSDKVKPKTTNKPQVSVKLPPKSDPTTSARDTSRAKNGSAWQECQPTSSKYKVEDFVGNEINDLDDCLWKYQALADAVHGTNSTRRLRDRPIPKPTIPWVYDPRMPHELNEVVAAMMETPSASTAPLTGYRQARSDEISETSEIVFDGMSMTATWCSKHPVRLSNTSEDEPRIRAVREQDKLKPQPPSYTRTTSYRSKGKQKDNSLSDEDIPRLRQQWHEEFADIVNGTKEELPPWRDVNHEIHLIDESKLYRYHLPRCPHSLQDQLRAKTNRYVNAG